MHPFADPVCAPSQAAHAGRSAGGPLPYSLADGRAGGAERVADLEEQIYREQIRLIYNQGPVLVLGATACAIMVTLFLWRHVPQSTLLFWLGAVGVTAVLRIQIIRAYLRAGEAVRANRHWGIFFWLGTLSAGCIWGAWPLMFYHLYSTEYLLLISTVFAGMVAVSAASGSIYLPSFLSFSMPLTIPLAITHLLSGSDSLVLTGLLLMVFLAVNYFLAARGNRQYRELIGARFENQALMRRLEAEKTIAQRAVVAKSRFLAAASHDLRQPLHAMGLFLGALLRHESGPTQKRIVEDMEKSAEALNGLFNSLLDVSRLDAEIIEFNPTHMPVSELFDGLRAQFVQQATEKGIELVVADTDSVLYTDAILLERVLRNLLANAVQYTAAGRISLGCARGADGACVVTLSDTGAGIPRESREDVFSEYYQLNNPERDRGKGLGLGLAIVRRLCELMDLPLSMESIEGSGTTFRIEVPGGDPAQVRRRRPVPAALGSHGGRVLVIDDEPQVLQSVRHVLESHGCEVMLAESARDALRVMALADHAPDAILSDYRLRGDLSGIDAIAAIRESLELDVPAVIITGDTSPERLKEVKRTGLELLHKPVSSDELCRVLERLLPRVPAKATAAAAAETGADTGTETRAETRAETAADTKAETGAETGADTKAETKSETEAGTGTVVVGTTRASADGSPPSGGEDERGAAGNEAKTKALSLVGT